MRMTRSVAIVSLCTVQLAGVLRPPLPAEAGSWAAEAGLQTHADTAQTAPSQFLPWPPPVPGPAPSDAPPAVPASDPFDARSVAATLEAVLAAVQRAMDRLRRWLDLLRQSAAGALTQIVVPLPVEAPPGVGPLDAVAEIAALPERWRDIAAAALAKLRVGVPDDAAVRHGADIAGSPELSHEAATIASADQQVISNVVQHEVAIAATAAVAEAAVRDTALPAATDAARATADQLLGGAQDLPSSRAGIELLVAGMGAGLRHQAALTAALASRITGLIAQTAQVSGQVGALASTLGVLTARDLERDRGTLAARLGVADAARGGGLLLQRLLEGAGEPADEIRLAPLY